MSDQVATLVRVSVQEIVQSLRERHHISDPFEEVRLEDDTLVFYFSRYRNAPEPRAPAPVARHSEVSVEEVIEPRLARRRRARKRRNRMKTRGWAVVTKLDNQKGQTAVIYKPFVDALSEQGLGAREKRKRVEEILRANGNKPSPNSVRYFLENTLEYLEQQKAPVVAVQ